MALDTKLENGVKAIEQLTKIFKRREEKLESANKKLDRRDRRKDVKAILKDLKKLEEKIIDVHSNVKRGVYDDKAAEVLLKPVFAKIESINKKQAALEEEE